MVLWLLVAILHEEKVIIFWLKRVKNWAVIENSDCRRFWERFQGGSLYRLLVPQACWLPFRVLGYGTVNLAFNTEPAQSVDLRKWTSLPFRLPK